MRSITKEQQFELERWNHTLSDYEEYLCIHEKLEMQSKETPNNIALSFNDKDFTYEELNKAANALANILLARNIKIEDNVIVHLNRSIELIISIYATLKAGGVYIPISPNYPEGRINHILKDCNPKMVITSKQFSKYYSLQEHTVFLIDDFIDIYQSFNLKNPDVNVSSRNLAYTIYTSGTTGTPKGVLIEHHSVLNRIGWMQKQFPLNENDVLLQKTAITFDVSIWELFWWTFSGAKLVLLPEGDEKKPDQLIKYIKDYKISIIHFVPSMFDVFIDIVEKQNAINQINSLRWIFCSGEKLKVNSVARFFQIRGNSQNKPLLVNLYGPTEATVDVTYYICQENKEIRNIPIGKPIDNTEIYIIDKTNKILTPGEEGELVICGVNLARGYLNRAKLTKDKFISLNVFGSFKKAYKTGDRAYFNDAGEIIFKGRLDTQIKLRGNRIELSEIEYTINQFNDIASCVCLLKNEQEPTAHIVAFVITHSNTDLNKSSLFDFLKQLLPDYMIPNKIITLEAFPLTAHGKLDQSKLMEFSDDLITIKDLSDTKIEKIIKGIWCDLLNRSSISLDMNFFDLGGNSLLVIQLSFIIKEKFDITISPIIIFEFPTIREFSKYISSLT